MHAASAGGARQQAKLTGSGSGANDAFGVSVAVSGSTAVVGAYGTKSNTGAAYVFVRSGGAWSQQAGLTAADGAADGYFGTSVALSGSTAVVGAPGANSATGAAYVFAGSGGTWSQQAELTAPGGGFGLSVALSGSTAVVSAPGANSFTGAAYVFAGSGGAWSQQAGLTAAHRGADDEFGFSVALSGSTAVAGAPGANSATGAACVFVKV